MPSAKVAAIIAAFLLCAPIFLASASAAGSFTPRQVPAVNDPETDYNDADLCDRLGGERQQAQNGEHVCSGLDRNDTFCIVGAAEALPCRGLFKHVILCNAGHNRPALNPFFCGASCADDRRARGGKCEIVATPVVSLAATVYAAAGYAGLAGAVEVTTGRTLDFVALPENFPLTLAKTPEGFAVHIRPPGLAASLDATLTAEITCAECYPATLTMAATFIPVFAPPQGSFTANPGAPLSAVSFNLPSLSDYPGLSGAEFADADADELVVHNDGRVTGEPARREEKTLRGYWTAAGMLGTLTLAINVTNPPAPSALRFAGVSADADNTLQDAGAKEFNATYWGRRRGLHFMVARLGKGPDSETPPALRQTAPDFETEKRRDPSREDSPDTRWSLADYAAFCQAGGDSGLSGRRWRPPTIGEVAALVYPGKNAEGDSLRLPRRLARVGIPGLLPSRNLRIPLPPHDGMDTGGPLPRGLMGAVNAGTPIVPGNEAGYSPTPGVLWSAAVGLDGYGAFLPWESRVVSGAAPLTQYLRGAVGYAACVVEAEDDYPPQPKLAVMEFSYAGKNVRCPVSARPAANCDEAGDFRSPDFIDSSFGDESAAAATIPVNAKGAGRVLKMVTVRALRFGGAGGSVGVTDLPGEAALASVSQSGAGALTMALISTGELFRSLRRFPARRSDCGGMASQLVFR